MFKIPLFAILLIFGQIRENSLIRSSLIWSHHCNMEWLNGENPCIAEQWSRFTLCKNASKTNNYGKCLNLFLAIIYHTQSAFARCISVIDNLQPRERSKISGHEKTGLKLDKNRKASNFLLQSSAILVHSFKRQFWQ